MSSCDVVQAGLIDEALPRTDAFDAHLAGCTDCRAFAAAHRSALRLSAVALSPPVRPLSEVKRRAGIVGGLGLAVVGAVGWFLLEFSAPAQPIVSVVEPEAPPQQVLEGDELLLQLAVLQYGVELELHREVREDEVVTRTFGALAAWTAPRRTQPIRSLELSTPIAFTQEDAP